MLVSFYAAFPTLVNNPFYITGESYAGIYIPMLAYNVFQRNQAGGSPAIPLKGIMVGNGASRLFYTVIVSR